MSFKVIITRDFDHMSEVASELVINDAKEQLTQKDRYTLGLATGNSPTGLYKHFAKAVNEGSVASSRIVSFNLDEYVGLPGENAQQRTLHPESYSFFMIQELFGLLSRKFHESNVPWGTLIDQEILERELNGNPDDWEEQGIDKGKAIVIRNKARSAYLQWIRSEVLDGYAEKITVSGGIDLQVVGVGGRGHVAFHEAGIPFENNKMLLVKLDENTVANAVEDGHFTTREKSPRYAVSMGAELVYRARTVILLANGARKAEPVAASLLNDVTPLIPISYGQILDKTGGRMIYVIDKMAAEALDGYEESLAHRGIDVEDLSEGPPARRVRDLTFFRDPETGAMG